VEHVCCVKVSRGKENTGSQLKKQGSFSLNDHRNENTRINRWRLALHKTSIRTCYLIVKVFLLMLAFALLSGT